MRLTGHLYLLLALVLAAAATAGPAKGTGGGKAGTSTIGGAAIDSTTNTPDMGTFTYNDTKRTSYTATIDCVRVEGNSTFFSGVIRVASKLARSMGIQPGLTHVYGQYYDGGEPEQDWLNLTLMYPDPEESTNYCEDGFEGSYYDLTHGNLQVTPTATPE